MAAKRPDDAYGSFGGVPDQVAESGTGGRSMDAHANPEDFGSQVGGAVQQLGGEGEQIAHRFGDQLEKSLIATGYEPKLITVPPGEESKTLANFIAKYTPRTGWCWT